MLLSTEQLVQQIHDSPTRIVLAASGGGSRAIADLLEVPGGSRTLLEAVVPYSAPAMIAWLGGSPDEFCSAATARAMAMSAFHRARTLESRSRLPGGTLARGDETNASCKLSEPNPQSLIPNPSSSPSLAGVACTASLASDRPKRGQHRIHVALQTDSVTAAWHLPLQKGRRTRAEEERLAGRLLLGAVAEASGLADRLTLELVEGEQVESSRIEAPAEWRDLLLGNVEFVRAEKSPQVPSGRRDLLFPGAFNPLHDGHRRMFQLAQEMLQQPAAWEISILNVDKPPLDYLEIARRLEQFPSEQPMYLSRAATFEEKSRLFTGATFVVGADTLLRIAALQYYGGDVASRNAAIDRIAQRGCRFLVYGRDLGEGFFGLGNIELPDALRSLCREVPEDVFRMDISSSGIRKSEN